MLKTLIVTDNSFALDLARELAATHQGVEIVQSPRGKLPGVPRLDLRDDPAAIVAEFDLVISLHCQQIFPQALHRHVRCVNVHPGFNPDNRGWYPHVFSLLNGLRAGVTIHEIDAEVDHGAVIVQRECPLEAWDTSATAYRKIMALERELLLEWFDALRRHDYGARPMESEGNLNRRKDYEDLRGLDLDERATLREFLDRLRALSHPPHRNAFFVDSAGRRVWVEVSLTPDDRELPRHD